MGAKTSLLGAPACTAAHNAKIHEGHSQSDMLGGLLVEFACGLHRLHALGVSRYDYLAMRQSEPALAEAFAHTYAVLRNTPRRDGARRYLSRVARQGTQASAKLGAAEHGFSYSHHGGRAGVAAGGAAGAGCSGSGQPRQPDNGDDRRNRAKAARGGGGRGGRGRGGGRA